MSKTRGPIYDEFSPDFEGTKYTVFTKKSNGHNRIVHPVCVHGLACVCVPSGRYPNRGGRLRRATDPRVWSTAGTLALAVGRAPNTHKHLFGPSPTSCRTSSSTTLQHNTNRTAYIIIIKRCCVIIVSRWPSRLSSAVCRRDRLWVTIFVCRATNGRRRNERRAVTVNSRHVHRYVNTDPNDA